MTGLSVVVEGGGTRTRAWLVDGAGAVCGEAAGGPSNVRRLGAPAFAALVRALVDRLAAQAGVAPAAITRLSIGVAGVATPAEEREVRDALAAHGLTLPAAVNTDAAAALEGALDGGPGVLLIAGTGSIALGRASDGRQARSGGWGRELGDEGSGYALGRAVLNRLTRALDRRRPDARVIGEGVRWLTVADDAALAGWIRDHAGLPERVAGMAEFLLHLAREGDGDARVLLEEAAAELALIAHAVCAQLDLGPRPVLVLHGGLMQAADYRAMVEGAFKQNHQGAQVRLGGPDLALKGGLRLAQALA